MTRIGRELERRSREKQGGDSLIVKLLISPNPVTEHIFIQVTKLLTIELRTSMN